MITFFESTGTLSALKEAWNNHAKNPAIKSLMILACDANNWEAPQIDPWLKALPIPVFGGIFPQVIYDRKNFATGTLLIGLEVVPEIICVKGLSDPESVFDEQLIPFADRWEDPETPGGETFVVFVDGLSKRIAALIQSMFFCFGLHRNFIGGGAGSLSFQQKPCLITPEGLLENAAVVAKLPIACGTGVAHGWQAISNGMKVTEAEGNVLKTLDWQPAFQVYRELVELHSGQTFTDNNFFEIARSYPFGITRLDTEVIVRDPLMKNASDGLVCVGEVPAGCFVRLLNGNPETLIAAASYARELAEKTGPCRSGSANAFIIDCVSRVLFLGGRISEELEAAAGQHRLFGALTLGEIANNGRDYLEFFNKTTVVGIFSETLMI
ncbi:MAG TPA: FIST N-terminal domain-containing protein [Candidatus Rifleibacterium sp.]|nr:FIST N-terminal domain-containing protein [Candidatus Rifleibacterium sp.]HPT46429.1 FIST N-terminal domain-containing protein [Candidatus Rifleibacterium sp.]